MNHCNSNKRIDNIINHITSSNCSGNSNSGRSKLKNCSDEEWDLRCELAAAYRLVHKFGWDEIIYNHLTSKVPGKDKHFLINPLGLRFDEITASSLVKIDIDGNIIENTTSYPINPAGFVIHSAIHAVRDDMHCVMHVHSVEGSAVMSQKHGLLPLCQLSFVALSAGVSYHEYEGLAVFDAEKVRLVRDLGPINKIFLLRNHGILTGGRTVAEAFFYLYYTIQACKIQVAALTAGIDNIHYAPPEVAANFKAGLQPFLQRGPGKEMFDALRRGLSKAPTNTAKNK